MGLVHGTLPILREAFAGKVERPRIEARIETPTRAHIIIDTQIQPCETFSTVVRAGPVMSDSVIGCISVTNTSCTARGGTSLRWLTPRK